MQLVINTFGASLRKRGEQFLVKAGDRKLAMSAHKVQSILVTTGVRLTTDAIELAISYNIDLVFLDLSASPGSKQRPSQELARHVLILLK